MTNAGRQSKGYEPRFDLDLKYGVQAERWVLDISRLLAEGSARIEVKHDAVFKRTGNLFIEYEHQPGRVGEFVPSGLAVTQADLWFISLDLGGSEVGLVIPVAVLKQLGRKKLKARCRIFSQLNGSCPTRGFALSLCELQSYLTNPASFWGVCG